MAQPAPSVRRILVDVFVCFAAIRHDYPLRQPTPPSPAGFLLVLLQSGSRFCRHAPRRPDSHFLLSSPSFSSTTISVASSPPPHRSFISSLSLSFFLSFLHSHPARPTGRSLPPPGETPEHNHPRPLPHDLPPPRGPFLDPFHASHVEPSVLLIDQHFLIDTSHSLQTPRALGPSTGEAVCPDCRRPRKVPPRLSKSRLSRTTEKPDSPFSCQRSPRPRKKCTFHQIHCSMRFPFPSAPNPRNISVNKDGTTAPCQTGSLLCPSEPLAVAGGTAGEDGAGVVLIAISGILADRDLPAEPCPSPSGPKPASHPAPSHTTHIETHPVGIGHRMWKPGTPLPRRAQSHLRGIATALLNPPTRTWRRLSHPYQRTPKLAQVERRSSESGA